MKKSHRKMYPHKKGSFTVEDRKLHFADTKGTASLNMQPSEWVTTCVLAMKGQAHER